MDHDDHAEQPAGPRRWRPWLARAVKLAFLGAVLYFVVRALVRQLGGLSWADLDVSFPQVAAAVAAVLAARTMTLLAYRPLLVPFGGRPGFRDLAALSWVPPLGRYVPGKVFTVAWAMSLLRRQGLSKSATIAVPLLITGLAALTGLTLAAPLTLWRPVAERIPNAWVWCLVLLAAGAACLHPKVLGGLGNAVLKRLGRQGRITLPSVGRYLAAVGAIAAQTALAGAALWLLANSLTDVSAAWIPVFVSGTGLAASMGLLAVFAPAGIGVREGILLVILTPAVGDVAAVLVIAIRCLQTFADVFLAGVGLVLVRSRPPGTREPSGTPPERP